jgi:hypothetical protein
MSSDAEVLAGHRLYPTRSTQVQEDILARGRIYLTDQRAFNKLANDGKQHVFENLTLPLFSVVLFLAYHFFLMFRIRIRARLCRADVKLGCFELAVASSA